MFRIRSRTELTYLQAEIFFFIFLCYLSTIIGSMEYGYTVKSDFWFFTTQLEVNLLYGTFGFVFFGVYYWCFLKRFVFEKRTSYLLLSTLMLIIAYGLYNKYAVNWSITKLPFVSYRYRQMAQEQLVEPNWGIMITPLLTTRLMVVIGFAYLIHSLQQTEQVKALRQERQSAELTYLKSRLQPHFFFNTLNNIYSLAMQQSEITGPMVSKLAEMMRYIIYESEQETVPLAKEIAFMENYVAIEKMRYRETVNIVFDVQYLGLDYQIQPLLLLPLVENAFKHGLQGGDRLRSCRHYFLYAEFRNRF